MNTPQRKQRILIVDDSPEDRELYRRLMTRSGSNEYSFLEADLGEDGLKLIRSTNPDCILLDYGLPDIDGLEFLSRLAEGQDDVSSPVVVLTGQGNEKIAVEAMKRGAQDYLVKGNLTPGSLRLTVDNTIGKVALQRKARELETIKSDFLSTASHELRTPLTIIREFVALVRDGVAGPVAPQQLECLDSALKNCDRLGNLINDLLDLQKIESGESGFNRSEIDVCAVIAECQRDFLPQCRKKGLSLEVIVADGLPTVLCDQDKTMQILVNLVSNALRFTPEGGKISIRASRTSPTDEFVTVEVQDTGDGISEEDQASVFDKFTQVNRQDGPGARGTGLGLAIVKNIVAMQDGQIGLKSSLGKGSTFSFTIPIYTNALATAAFVEDRLARAAAADKELTVTLIRVDSATRLEEIERLICSTLRRKKDATHIVHSERTILVAAEVDNKYEGALRRRIEEEIAGESGIMIANTVIRAGDSVRGAMDEVHKLLAPPNPVVPAKRVLVVDDQEELAEVVSAAFETSQLTIRIDVARDGYDAWLNLGDFKPDLIILDIDMPGFDEGQILNQIKNTARGYAVKILVVSSSAQKCETLDDHCVDAYLIKPFNIGALIHKSGQLLEEEVISNA